MQINLPIEKLLPALSLQGKRTHISGLGLIAYAIYSITTYVAQVPDGTGIETLINGILQTEGWGILAALMGTGLMAQRAGTSNAKKTLEEKIDELSAQLAERDKVIAASVLEQLQNPTKGPST